jgi:tripeptidyl-peptidase II
MLRRNQCLLSAFALVAGTALTLANFSPLQVADADEAPRKGEVIGEVLGLMPKQETGALDFIRENPEFNGKGVVVAIFDTGVDPGAVGLQTTPDGRPKVIDIVDATGSGDVDMSTEVKVEDGKVTGLTGRILKLDAKWKIPSGKVRIGKKPAYEIFPSDLQPRIKAYRKKKFQEAQSKIETSYRARIEAIDSGRQKGNKGDLEKRLAQLIAAGKSYSDPGPICDCVVFNDGKTWRAAVDTDEDGDFADEEDMTNYRVAQEWDQFDSVSLVNFGVNIYENGHVLSIVNDCHPHGTHVAGIVSANYPKKPEFNGVAPGAQIVSVRIGDNYIDGMETGTGLIRGVKAVLQNKCDLVNMSFGEPTKAPNRGLIVNYFKELVNKHGVIFIASAGNAGPALSTVGAPGGTTSELIGVGAYVSPKMMAAEYALRTQGAGLGYTWTSRGPTFDGDLGVSLFAPGGAIAPVPQWTLDKSMRMNGTSMASPNCCGNFALALSGLKAKKINYTPASVRRAFENTAKPIATADVFGQGYGLVQTGAAYDALVRDARKPFELIPLSVAVSGGKRGIYLREPNETAGDAEPQEFTVQVRPQFHPNASSKQKVAYRLRLTLESGADWAQCGEEITVTNGGASFSVLVDPRKAELGANYAEVVGYDADDKSRGPLFRLPMTVCRPVPSKEWSDGGKQKGTGPILNNGHMEENLEMQPGDITRRFLVVPDGATWVDIRFQMNPQDDGGKSRIFMLHAVQAIPGLTNRDAESNIFMRLSPGVPSVQSFAVQPGRTIEVAIAQYWSSLGKCSLNYELTFHGITPSQNQVSLVPGDLATKVEVSTPLHYEHLEVTAKITTVRKLVKASSAKIKQLQADRDGYDEGRIFHQLELTYPIESSGGAVTPKFSKTDDLLYDSDYGGTLWAIYSKAGRRVATDDIWTAPVALAKGSYTLKMWVRHTSLSKLNAVKSMTMALESSLKSPITLATYPTLIAAQNGGPKFSSKWISPGERQRIFVGNISSVPAGTAAGDVLLGTITFGKKGEHGGAGQLPGGFTLTASVPAISSATATTAAAKVTKWDDRLKTAGRDAKMAHLKSVAGSPTPDYVTKMPADVVDGAKVPDALFALFNLDQTATRKNHLPKVVEAADSALKELNGALPKLKEADMSSLNALLGKDPKLTAAKKRAEWVRDAMADVLYRKGRALGYMELPEVLEKHPIEDKKAHDKAFNENFTKLKALVDTKGSNFVLLHIRNETRRGRHAEALELLTKHAASDPTNYWYMEKRRKLYGKLGWRHLESIQRLAILSEHPNGKP